jgi:hypothetical protein
LFQEVLGQECISLEFRHIASYLLWYCQSHNVNDLLHLTIILVGYFAARNTDNQVTNVRILTPISFLLDLIYAGKTGAYQIGAPYGTPF